MTDQKKLDDVMKCGLKGYYLKPIDFTVYLKLIEEYS